MYSTTKAGRPRIQRYVWQLILVPGVLSLSGHMALFIKPKRWNWEVAEIHFTWDMCFHKHTSLVIVIKSFECTFVAKIKNLTTASRKQTLFETPLPCIANPCGFQILIRPYYYRKTTPCMHGVVFSCVKTRSRLLLWHHSDMCSSLVKWNPSE